MDTQVAKSPREVCPPLAGMEIPFGLPMRMTRAKHACFLAAVVLLPSFRAIAASPQRPIASAVARRHGKLVFIEVKVNQSGPFWFAFDSGAHDTLIDPFVVQQALLRLSPATSTITGTGEGEVYVRHAVPVTMRIQDLIGSGTALSQFPPFQFLQKPGPYPVGLKVVNQYDPSRKFPATPDRPEAPARQGSRPLQTLIWYPALPSGIKSMKVGDYVALADTEISFGAPDQEHNKWRRRLKSSFDVPLWGVRDAKMADGHYPVLIYAPSDSSMAWENADLCEYLASHGYVVLASPSMGASTRDMTDDLAGIDTQALDISFLISYAATLPDTDPSKVAVVSFSWGGISSLFAAARDTRIQVLAEMDGSIRYYPALVVKAGSVHPEQLNVPLLFFTSNRENFIEDIEHSDITPGDMMGPNVLNEWTDADVMTINMLGMSHPEFCSMFERFKTPKDFTQWDQVADYGRNDANTSYSWVALYTLQFLNAYLKHDGAAKAFLGRTPAENDVPIHIMGIRFSPKSFAEIMRSAARTGEQSAWEAFQRFAADPMHRYMTGEERTINRLGYAFLQEKDPSSAVVLFKLNAKAYPDSANAWDSLGDGYKAMNDIQDAGMAYARSVELNPGNEHAKRELVKLRK